MCFEPVTRPYSVYIRKIFRLLRSYPVLSTKKIDTGRSQAVFVPQPTSALYSQL